MIPQSSIRGLSFAGLVLIGLYISIAASSLFPIQLLVPDWQLKMGTTLINSSPVPLIGLALLHLAADLKPNDNVLGKRCSITSQLAVVASMGFLLLVPLLSVASVTQYQQQNTNKALLISRADTSLQMIRQEVANASNTTELHDKLAALNGPILNAADRSLPLPVIKAQVNRLLDQAAAQVKRKQGQMQPSHAWLLLPSLLRNAFTSFILSLGFAGLARRPGSTISLLNEWQNSLKQLKLPRINSAKGSKDKRLSKEYLKGISLTQESNKNKR